MYPRIALSSLLLGAAAGLASASAAGSKFAKRDSWGPAFSLGPAKASIVSTQTTIYPGAMPADQQGYLFVWLGISNGTGDLVQSIVGSYPKGASECSGSAADSTWCISSEVYGNNDQGVPNQWVGSLTTADVNYENGIVVNYTLVDKSSYLWLQTMTDAVTGDLLSTYNKTSGPMTGWGTALECQDGTGGVACAGTVETQYWINSTIILESADSTFVNTLGASTGVVYTDMTTADNGLTWTIQNITVPAMNSSGAAASVSGVSSSSVVASATSLAPAATATGSAAAGSDSDDGDDSEDSDASYVAPSTYPTATGAAGSSSDDGSDGSCSDEAVTVTAKATSAPTTFATRTAKATTTKAPKATTSKEEKAKTTTKAAKTKNSKTKSHKTKTHKTKTHKTKLHKTKTSKTKASHSKTASATGAKATKA